MRSEFSKRLLNVMLLIIAITLVDLYWIFEDYWYRWFGLIGFAMIGWFWRSE